MGELVPMGSIVRLQVQRERLKGTGAYDPAPLLAVAEAALTPGGMLGRHDGGWVVDVHHRDHPQGRGGGSRALSVGFTGHYTRMRDRYGEVAAGVAGENLIVDYDGVVTEDDLMGGLVIRTLAGDVTVDDWKVAAPCLEFTSFLLGREPRVEAWRDELAGDRDFLHRGTRGFVAGLGHLDGPVVLRIGDEVWRRVG